MRQFLLDRTTSSYGIAIGAGGGGTDSIGFFEAVVSVEVVSLARWRNQIWFYNRGNCSVASRLFGLSANTRRKQYSRWSGAETQYPNPSHPCSDDGSISTTCANSAVACTKLPDFAAAIPVSKISSFDKISSVYLQSSRDTDILIPKCNPDLGVSGFEMMYQYIVQGRVLNRFRRWRFCLRGADNNT